MIFHRETITDGMYNVARVIFQHFDVGYYLAGGTALALRMGHRKSIDLDYFIAQPINTLLLKQKIMETFPFVAVEILFEEKNTLWCIIDGVKISFISRFVPLIGPVEIIENFRLADIKDITVMKLAAVCGREEYKDYFDLACIAIETDIRSWVFWWQEAYPEQDVMSWVVALSAVSGVQEIPLESQAGIKGKDVVGRIEQVVGEITRQARLFKDSPKP